MYKTLGAQGYEVLSLVKGQCSESSDWHHLRMDLQDNRVIPNGYPFAGTLVGLLQSYCGKNPINLPFYYIAIKTRSDWHNPDIIPIATMGLTYADCILERDFVPTVDSTDTVPIDPAPVTGARPIISGIGMDSTTIIIVGAAALAAFLLVRK